MFFMKYSLLIGQIQLHLSVWASLACIAMWHITDCVLVCFLVCFVLSTDSGGLGVCLGPSTGAGRVFSVRTE
jgi:hypothetical protein